MIESTRPGFKTLKGMAERVCHQGAHCNQRKAEPTAILMHILKKSPRDASFDHCDFPTVFVCILWACMCNFALFWQLVVSPCLCLCKCTCVLCFQVSVKVSACVSTPRHRWVFVWTHMDASPPTPYCSLFSWKQAVSVTAGCDGRVVVVVVLCVRVCACWGWLNDNLTLPSLWDQHRCRGIRIYRLNVGWRRMNDTRGRSG